MNTNPAPFLADDYDRHPFDVQFSVRAGTVRANGENSGFRIPADRPIYRAWAELFAQSPQTLHMLQTAADLITQCGIDFTDAPGYEGKSFVQQVREHCHRLTEAGTRYNPRPYDPESDSDIIVSAVNAALQFGTGMLAGAKEDLQDNGIQIPADLDGIVFEIAKEAGAFDRR